MVVGKGQVDVYKPKESCCCCWNCSCMVSAWCVLKGVEVLIGSTVV